MAASEEEYRPFPEKPSRNTRQQTLEVPLFIRVLKLASRRRILEVGCGAGVALPVIHRLCSTELLIGLDTDERALRQAAQRIVGLEPTVTLINADVRRIPVESEAFDAVIDFGTCYHIAKAGHAVREIERVLKPGGVFATEAKLSQLLSHPVRSWGRGLPIIVGGGLRLRTHCGLWLSFDKVTRT
jgi:ubiquinone/menaquinone biosynthesis C-methylase UbiE